MNQRVQEVLNDTYGNYIMPFFWLHGTEEKILRNCMSKINECGIKAVCLEARPHKDFIGDGWWHDLNVILDEAKKRGMKIWILDDSHFPTGYANGAVEQAPDYLKRWSLVERTLEICGPKTHCKLEVASRLGYHYTNKAENKLGKAFEEKLVAVVMGKRIETADGEVIFTELQDITAEVTEDGWICKDFPEGEYSLFIYTKRLDAAAGNNNYISMIEKESVKLLLDTVYEPHYMHYKEEFGKTILGFFSDEPGFYNLADSLYGLGQMGEKMPLPWTDDVKRLFVEKMREEGLANLTMLTGLFHKIGGAERLARYTYMDIITKKYQECFTDQLGKWCEERNVEYIGHVLEDGLFTQSLGAGTGHYFRALHGQHMSGIDVVLNDLLPDKDYGDRIFYHYQLPILAASYAQQFEQMQGRAMCEIFGAFGWSEGLDMMKWMADFMLVNGINYFVPHAFTDSEFPDPDCPPHFYAQGNNPQFRHMYKLYEYMNRVCHLFNGGYAVTDVAVFFPAEGGWTGKCRDFGYIGKICLQNQIPYAVLCMDMLKKAEVHDGNIEIGQASYKCLIVDKMDYLPADYLRIFERLAEKGACIRFIDAIPNTIEDSKYFAVNEDDGNTDSFEILREEELLFFLEKFRICKLEKFEKQLRVRRYEQGDGTIFMFTNCSMIKKLKTEVEITDLKECSSEINGKSEKLLVGYDALNQKLFHPTITSEHRLKLSLDRGESLIFFMGNRNTLSGKILDIEEYHTYTEYKESDIWENYQGVYCVSAADYSRQDKFEKVTVTENLESMDSWKKDFAGIIRYEITVEGKKKLLDIGECNGSAEVWVNGKPCGVRISYPYVFDIEKAMIEGQNLIRIEVATTLFEAMKDPLSMERAVDMAGMYGRIRLAEADMIK